MEDEFEMGDWVVFKRIWATKRNQVPHQVARVENGHLVLHANDKSKHLSRWFECHLFEKVYNPNENNSENQEKVSQMTNESNPNLISMDKTYYMRKDMKGSQPKPGAKPVRVLCVDNNDDTYPVIYCTSSGVIVSTTSNGSYFHFDETNDFDLIEHKPLRKVEYYINKYGKPASPDGHEKDSYIFQNKVEYTFDGNKLVDVKLIND